MCRQGRVGFAARVTPTPPSFRGGLAPHAILVAAEAVQPVEPDAAAGQLGAEATKGTMVALVPAHNEAAGIRATLESLARQTRPADRVVVIADNCTDDTAGIAADAGAEVYVTVGNRHKKAGALNQALAQILPTLGPNDAVLVMDADSTLAAEFVAVAGELLGGDAGLGAVGGVFLGTPDHGLVGQLQRNEYRATPVRSVASAVG